MSSPMKRLVVNTKERMARWNKDNNVDEKLYWKNTALDEMLREA